jgi:hypothetical protein
MDKREYLNNLKTIDLRPGKVKVHERQEPQVLMEQQVQPKENITTKIIEWFMKNPNPPDSKVHAFAEELGIEPDKLESNIYKILSDILSGGKSKDFKGSYNSKELAMGIKIEKEHTGSNLISEKIAKDHLSEIPDYYSRLTKMEKAAGINEIFVQTAEIQAMDDGEERDAAMLRLSIIAELDAANLYERFANIASSQAISEVMLDIAKEEKVHAGEFQTLLDEIDDEYRSAREEGEGEVNDLVNKQAQMGGEEEGMPEEPGQEEEY